MQHLPENVNTLEKMMLSRAAAAQRPINGTLELLPLCNMNCDMCYIRLSRAEMEERGRLHTADEWISLGRQMQQAGALFLLITGGEPLLFPDFRRLYTELRQMGMIFTINTNGTLLDEEWADFFGKQKPRRINITLYGADDKAYESLCHYPGGFEKTLRAIRLLKERGVDVKINGFQGGIFPVGTRRQPAAPVHFPPAGRCDRSRPRFELLLSRQKHAVSGAKRILLSGTASVRRYPGGVQPDLQHAFGIRRQQSLFGSRRSLPDGT